MTQEEALERGMVPTAPIVALIEMQAMEEDAMLYDERIWFKVKEEAEHVEFDTVDRMLCALHLQGQWTRGDLREIYYGVNLSGKSRLYVNHRTGERDCARPGCTNRFVRSRTRGKSRQMYCSKSCTQIASRLRRDADKPGHKGKAHVPAEGRQFVCRNGHVRTPQNTETLKNGTKRCRDCNRERTQEFRRRQKTMAEAAA